MIPEDPDKKYCICQSKNHTSIYVMCESECDWFHPECLGFDSNIVNEKNLKFICPMCKDQKKRDIYELVKRENFKLIESRTKRGYLAFIPQPNTSTLLTNPNEGSVVQSSRRSTNRRNQ